MKCCHYLACMDLDWTVCMYYLITPKICLNINKLFIKYLI